jgi:hypothetical protein
MKISYDLDVINKINHNMNDADRIGFIDMPTIQTLIIKYEIHNFIVKLNILDTKKLVILYKKL